MTTVAVVIPVRNDAARLEVCLRSIRANRYPREHVEIIVADNGSTDDSAAVAQRHGAVLLDLPHMRLGELRNTGVRAASQSDVIAFIDADHEIVPDWIASAVEALAADGVGAVGYAYDPPPGGTWVQRLYDRLRQHPATPLAVDWLGSGNMAVRRSTFEAAGGFDTSLETCEDVDLCRRFRALRFGVVADRRLRSIHYGDPRTIRDVFVGELWRGRDNIRVSFRPPRTWRTSISAVIPVANLVAMTVVLAGVLSRSHFGSVLALAFLPIPVVLVGIRTVRMVIGVGRLRELPLALLVAIAYQSGRALALIGGARYGARRKMRHQRPACERPISDARDKPPTVSFIIPVRDDARRLERCLDSILACHYPREQLEIVVADNGSIDDSAQVARVRHATVLSLPTMKLGSLRNHAVAASVGSVLVFVDADHEIVPGWVSSAVELLSETRVAAVGAPCRPPSPPTWVQRMYDQLRRHPASREVVSWLGTGNMAVRRSAFEAARGFDTTLETCEDVDLCRKLRSLGFRLVADRRLGNVHYGDPETLKQVVYGEMWRGRDNVRVSLRPPRAWRTILSAAIPMFNLLAVTVVVTDLIWDVIPGYWLAVFALASLCSVVGLRASVMVRRSSFWDAGQAIAVAAAYELGRTMALVARLGHGRRRKAAAE